MRIIISNYRGIKKYILFTKEDNKYIMHYVYKIFFDAKYTELTEYKDNKIQNITKIDQILNFSEADPLSSVNKFHRALLLK